MLVEQRWDVIPGAESPESLRARVRGALERIVAAHPDERVVVVTHGGVIAEIMAQVADTRRPFAFLGCDNASISQVVAFAGRWILRRFNDTAHLDRDLDRDRTSTRSRTCQAAEAVVHPRASCGASQRQTLGRQQTLGWEGGRSVLAGVGAEAPDVVLEVAHAEAGRAVVLVAHLAHDDGAGGRRFGVHRVGIGGDDVDRGAARRQP